MARPLSKEPKVRLNLELTERSSERLEHLMDLIEADSKTEVLRRSLQLYEVLLELASGGTLILKKTDGTEEVILLK